MESVDNLDRALSTVPTEQLSPSSEKDNSDESSTSDENKALVSLYQGLKMTERILMQTLKKHGLERFDPSEDGTRFDPRLHEATFQTKVEGKEDGEVVMVQQKGFMLNGRVLRVCSPSPGYFYCMEFRKIVNREKKKGLFGGSLPFSPDWNYGEN